MFTDEVSLLCLLKERAGRNTRTEEEEIVRETKRDRKRERRPESPALLIDIPEWPRVQGLMTLIK